MTLMPVEFDHIGKAALAEEAAKPKRHHHRHMRLARQPRQRALIQMVVVIVADGENIDPGQRGNRHARLHEAARPEACRPRIGGEIGIRQNGEAANPNEKGGMAEPGEKILALLRMGREIAHGLCTRDDMALRYLDLAGTHLEHFEEERPGMAHPPLTTARAPLGVAECPVRQMVPRLSGHGFCLAVFRFGIDRTTGPSFTISHYYPGSGYTSSIDRVSRHLSKKPCQ